MKSHRSSLTFVSVDQLFHESWPFDQNSFSGLIYAMLSGTSMNVDSGLPYEEREQQSCSGGARGPDSIPDLVATISENGYLLLLNRDMAEISLKRRKSSKQPTNYPYEEIHIKFDFCFG